MRGCPSLPAARRDPSSPVTVSHRASSHRQRDLRERTPVESEHQRVASCCSVQHWIARVLQSSTPASYLGVWELLAVTPCAAAAGSASIPAFCRVELHYALNSSPLVPCHS